MQALFHMKHVEPAFLLTRRRGYFILRASVMPASYTSVIVSEEPPVYDLTVITVCRNVLPELKRTVASVLGQKAVFPEMRVEHIIIDGASTDGTPEWLEGMKRDGKIEAYLSEPDRGIYDAMNKGINLARGAVSLFLNADDTFTHVDLADCVFPIVRGEYVAAAAVTRQYSNSYAWLFAPDTESLYLKCPFCHQAFFAATRALRELGGFDSQSLRCACDTELMYRIIGRYGMPKLLNEIVTNMPMGGFSTGAGDKFLDEHIALLYRYREQVMSRCRDNESYRGLILSVLLCYSLKLGMWQRCYRPIPERVSELAELSEVMQPLQASARARQALRVAAAYLRALSSERAPSLLSSLRLLYHYRRNSIPAGSPFRSFMVGSRPMLRQLLSQGH